MGWIVGIGSFYFWGSIYLSIIEGYVQPAGAHFVGFIATIGMIIAMIYTGIFTSRIIRSYIENRIKSNLFLLMEEKEKEILQKL